MSARADVLANHEVVTIAVYLLRGDLQSVDTEDVAVKAAEVAPGRFSWRKYPEQINFESVRRRLTTAADEYGFLVGSQRDGWRLTDKGRRFAEAAAVRLEGADERRPISLREKQWASHEKLRMMSTTAFQVAAAEGIGAVTTAQAEEFFRIDEYVRGDARLERIYRVANLLGQDADVGGIVQGLAALVERGTKHE